MIKHININDLHEKYEYYSNFFNHIDIEATNSGFKIYNNYNSNFILYIRILNDDLYISLNYLDFKIPINVNFKELSRLYKDEFKLFFNVFDKGIVSLPHGFYFEYYKNGNYVVKRIVNNNYEIINNPVECLEYVLKKYVKLKNVAISFSSGLDSTAILYACKSVFKNSNLCAYTWKSDHCSNDDLINSRKICNKLGIKLIEFHLDSKYLLTDIKPENFIPFPSSHLGFANFLQYINSKILLYFNNESFVNINSHGGDHIFFESLPLQYVIKELKYHPTKLKEYLNLYSLNYFVLFRALKYSKDFKIFREYSIQEALYQTAMLNPDLKKYNYFFPYATEEMITSAEQYSPIQTFNSKFTRVHFRNALKDFYNSEDFFRKSKGHMTGAYQNALLENLTKFKKMFDKGYLSKNKDFDLNKVICDMELSALGVGGMSFNLMTSIIFELQIKLIKEKCYELS